MYEFEYCKDPKNTIGNQKLLVSAKKKKKKQKQKKKSVWFVNFCQSYISGESYLEVLIEEKLHCCRPVQKLKDKYTSITQKRILTFDKIQ